MSPRRAAPEFGSASAVVDSKLTLLCTPPVGRSTDWPGGQLHTGLGGKAIPRSPHRRWRSLESATAGRHDLSSV